jgi:hypothetical protein
MGAFYLHHLHLSTLCHGLTARSRLGSRIMIRRAVATTAPRPGSTPPLPAVTEGRMQCRFGL